MHEREGLGQVGKIVYMCDCPWQCCGATRIEVGAYKDGVALAFIWSQ